VRLALVSIAVTLLLFAFFFTKYMIDKSNLRRLTLAAETSAIFTALRHNQDPLHSLNTNNFRRPTGSGCMTEVTHETPATW
jgi:hypothetical protein